MHGDIDLILTLTGGLTAALILGYITQRIGLSPIVGYLLAGVAVGPSTPGFMADRDVADQLAEVGVILLMFGVGLQFHLKELLAVRRIAIPGAVFQSVVASVLGVLISHLFGWSWTAGAVYGLAISVASTVVLVRVLADNHDLHTPTGHIAVGWLVVEDLFTVLVLVVMPALFGPKEDNGLSMPVALVLAGVKIAFLVFSVFFLGGRVIPWLLTRIAATRSRELFTLTVLVVALGIAVGSAKLFGVSMALGAFLAGMVVGRSEFSLRAATEALPMRDAFAVLFFVSVGMLLDPMFILQSPGLVIATLLIVMIGKPLAAAVIVIGMGYPLRVALGVSVALAQIGEFSFILAKLGDHLNLVPEALANTLVATAIVSISVNPLLYRLVDPAASWIMRRPRLARLVSRTQTAGSAKALEDASQISVGELQHRAVVVGFGPVGQTVCRLLNSNGVESSVIEMNLETVKRLRSEGVVAVYGDAGHPETLLAAGVTHSSTLILSASGLRNAREVIRLAHELNPQIRVIVRTTYLRENDELIAAGADRVYSGEGEVALAMTESILRDLGAIPEQIDRERQRVRQDLFGGSRMTGVFAAIPKDVDANVE